MDKDLCIVTARGGSKRVPQKNVRSFAGKPLVAWPVSVAVESGLFSDVLISTEDDAIANAAVEAGAIFPFRRPVEMANDYSTTVDVLRCSLHQWQDATNNLPEYCCCLYGTSAFITVEFLRQGRALLKDADWVMAVSEYPHPIQRALRMTPTGKVSYFHPENVTLRTQDCEKAFYDIGLFYYFSVAAFMADTTPGLSQVRRKAVVVPRTRAVDIDTEEDWKQAELLARAHL